MSEILPQQECIPVGCIPSAAAAVSREGGVWSGRGGVCVPGPGKEGVLQGGVCSWRGVCLLSGGVRSGGCVCSGGVSAPRVIPAGTEAAPPPVDRMTDRCKNITFATSLRTVKMVMYSLRLTCMHRISLPQHIFGNLNQYGKIGNNL